MTWAKNDPRPCGSTRTKTAARAISGIWMRRRWEGGRAANWRSRRRVRWRWWRPTDSTSTTTAPISVRPSEANSSRASSSTGSASIGVRIKPAKRPRANSEMSPTNSERRRRGDARPTAPARPPRTAPRAIGIQKPTVPRLKVRMPYRTGEAFGMKARTSTIDPTRTRADSATPLRPPAMAPSAIRRLEDSATRRVATKPVAKRLRKRAAWPREITPWTRGRALKIGTIPTMHR